MSLFPRVRDRFDAMLVERRRRREAVEPSTVLPKPFDVGDVFRESIAVLGQLIALVQSTGADGPAKRAAVMEGIGVWYDAVIAPLDIPYVPDLIADPILKRAVLYVADKALDGLADVVKGKAGVSVGAAVGAADPT